MSMRLPTFSALPLAMECVFPWRSGIPWPKDNGGKYAGFGRAVSSVGECIAVMGDAPVREIADANDLPDADLKRLDYAAFYLRRLFNETWGDDTWRCAEAPLAYDTETGRCRFLPGGSRDYRSKRRSEMTGTPDIVRISSGGRLSVCDFKTGTYAAGKSPLEYPQLRALALCAARALGFDEVDGSLIQVDDQGAWVNTETLDCFDLDAVDGELRELYRRLTTDGIVEPRAGSHCHGHYCKIVSQCPAIRHAAALVLPDMPQMTPHIRDAEHAQWTRERVKAVKRALEQIESAVDEFASRQPIPCGDGKVYGRLEKSRESVLVNGDVLALLREMGAEDAMEKRLTKAALKRAVYAASERGRGAANMRNVMAKLEECGALRTYTYATFAEFKPGEPSETSERDREIAESLALAQVLGPQLANTEAGGAAE